MQLFLGVLFSCLLVTTIALPTLRIKRQWQSDIYARLAALINKIKSEETYTTLKGQLSSHEAALKMFTNFAGQLPHDADFHYRKAQYVKVMEPLLDLLKGIMPESAHPSESEVTELAKKLSQALRETKFVSYNFIPDGTQFLMTNSTIAKLQDICISKPILEEGNDFMAIIKETDEGMHKIATVLKLSSGDPASFATSFTDKETDQFNSAMSSGKLFYIAYQMLLDHYATLLRSEETATEFFKDFAMIVKAVKNPSTYESLRSLRRAFSESKKADAMLVFVGQGLKSSFFLSTMSEKDKDELCEVFEGMLQIFKAMFANGPTTDQMTIMMASIDWMQENQEGFINIVGKLAEAAQQGNRSEFKARDLFTEKEAQMLEEVILSSEDEILISDEKLNELRSKSEIVNAMVYWINDHIRAERRFQGLGPEADAFDKKYKTAPMRMKEWIAEGQFPRSEVLKEKMLKDHSDKRRDFNALSGEAKKELCAAYPHATILYLVKLK